MRSATSERRGGLASSAGPRWPRSTSPAGSPTRSGTCSPARRSSLPEAPLFVWRPDVCLLSEEGERLDQLAVPPDIDSLRRLAHRIDAVHGEPVCAVVESMTGARLIHDTLEQEGWSVEIADAQKVK